MPHVPDSHTHADHDPALIAAHAAGDATGDELATAAALVASCAPCAELHADLRAIAAATAALPAPVRRRDFRLTPEQAASLRPRGWRRLRDALAGPGFRFATPLGTGLATLGLATLLVANLGSVQLGGATSGAGVDDGSSTRQESVIGAPSAAPAEAPSAAAPAAAGGAGEQVPAPSPDVDTLADGSFSAGSGAAAASPGVRTEAFAPSEPPRAAEAASAEELRARGADEILFLVGGAGVLVGLALVALRWTSRRLA